MVDLIEMIGERFCSFFLIPYTIVTSCSIKDKKVPFFTKGSTLGYQAWNLATLFTGAVTTVKLFSS